MDYKQYKDYSLEELAANPHFRNWVLNPTEELHIFWSAFLEEYPQKRLLVKNAQTLVQSVYDHFHQDEVDKESLEQYFKEVRQRANRSGHIKKKKRALSPFLMKAAAAVVVLLLAGSSYLFFGSGAQIETFETAYGERLEITLPDGSLAKLNANSQLKVKKAAPGQTREVWLNGEAFFTVKKMTQTQAKFVVHTKGLDIEVLGTQFNVNTRRENTQVLLEEGKVRLSTQQTGNKQQKIELQPGELAAYSKKTGQIFKTLPKQTETYLSWKDGYLIYEKATIGEIIQDIQSTYGVDVRITDSLLLKKTIRGALPTDNFDEFLKMVETLFDVEITKSGNQILLEPSID